MRSGALRQLAMPRPNSYASACCHWIANEHSPRLLAPPPTLPSPRTLPPAPVLPEEADDEDDDEEEEPLVEGGGRAGGQHRSNERKKFKRVRTLSRGIQKKMRAMKRG